MPLMILGLILWWAAHLFKRIAPERRAAMGETGRGPIALALVLAVICMVLGYRMADTAVIWGRSPAMVGINNLLMVLAVYLFAAAGAKTALARKMRHPMLISVKVWALAHLLVNGDVASIILFGGLLAWAVVEVILINRAEPDWTPPPPAPRSKEISAVVATCVVYVIAVGIHYLTGHPTFG